MSTTLERPVTGAIAPTPEPETPFAIRIDAIPQTFVFNGTPLIAPEPETESPSFIQRLAGMLGGSAMAPTISPVAPSPAPAPAKTEIRIPSWVHPYYHAQFREIATHQGFEVATKWYSVCSCSGPRGDFLGR